MARHWHGFFHTPTFTVVKMMGAGRTRLENQIVCFDIPIRIGEIDVNVESRN